MVRRDSFQALIATVLLALLAIAVPQAFAQGGQKWAVIIGMSKFQKLAANEQLEFADKDAEAFSNFIQSPRGREFPKDNVKTLLNHDATLPKARDSLSQWLNRNAKTEDVANVFL